MTLPANREHGIALVFVLWVVALLAILTVGFAYEMGTQARIARNQYDGARARALADAGVSLAILGVLGGGPEAWRLDGSVRQLAYNGGRIRLRLQDEAGKIDLNYAAPAVLADLLRLLSESNEDTSDLADNIVAWKRRRLVQWRGPEGQPAQASSGPFLAVEELREVAGVSREIYDRVAPFVTVLSRSARVDPMSAPREVLLSLPGADARAVDAYVAARSAYGPDQRVLPALGGPEPYLAHDKAGQYISILSEGRADPDGVFVRDATISLIAAGGQPYRFVSWGEGGSAPE